MAYFQNEPTLMVESNRLSQNQNQSSQKIKKKKKSIEKCAAHWIQHLEATISFCNIRFIFLKTVFKLFGMKKAKETQTNRNGSLFCLKYLRKEDICLSQNY